MGRAVSGASVLRTAIEKIESVRLDGGAGGFVAELRRCLGFDAMVYVRLVERTVNWGCDAVEADGVSNVARLRRAVSECLEATAQPVPWLDLRQPPAEQANKAIDLEALVGSSRYRNSSAYRRIVAPTELADHWVARMLICDKAKVVAWIGGFSENPISIAQLDGLSSIAASLRERVRIERQLGSTARVHAALDATLQQIGVPALLVDGRNRVHEMNEAARELLETRREDVFASISAVRARKVPLLPFTVTRVSGAQPEHFLAVMRPRTADAKRSLAVTLAANRWRLTPRQTEVLRMLVRGDSNLEIAKSLAITPRAAERHVSGIFDRAGVENRSQLVAAVLLG